MSKDAKITAIKFRTKTTIGPGDEWTIDNTYGYTVTEDDERGEIVFSRLIEHEPNIGKIQEIRVPRTNVAQIAMIRDPQPVVPAPVKAGNKGVGAGKDTAS